MRISLSLIKNLTETVTLAGMFGRKWGVPVDIKLAMGEVIRESWQKLERVILFYKFYSILKMDRVLKILTTLTYKTSIMDCIWFYDS